MAKPRKVGKKWRIEVRRKGIHKSGTFSTKAEAVAWGENTTRLILGGTEEYSKEYDFSYIAKKYLDEVATHKKGWRWEDIRINAFMPKLKHKKIIQMPSKFWKDWISNRLTEVSPSTVNRELNLLSAVFEHAKECELTNENPIREHRDRVITDDEIEQITEKLTLDPTTSSGQTGIAFLLAIETGMRRGELMKLERSDVDLNMSYAIVRDSKNGDKRDIPLSVRAVELFKILGCDMFTISPDTLSQLFKRCCTRLDIDNVTFHDARHLATIRLSKKINVLDLARMLGHRDLKSLMVYLQVK